MGRLKDLEEIVHTLLLLVPLGRVVSYGELARITGTSPRVIGMIMKRNKKPVIVPCHRVVKSNGELGGYSFGGSKVKRKLLELEGVGFDGRGRVVKDYFYSLTNLLSDP